MTNRFFETATQSFAFLEDQYDFSAKPAGEREVSYGNADVQVRVVQSAIGAAKCVYVTVTSITPTRSGKTPEFTMGEIIRLKDPQNPAGRRLLQFENEDQLPAILDIAAEELRTYGGDFLSGDMHAFERSGEFRGNEIKSQTLDSRTVPIRQKALAAFARQNFAEAVAGFEKIESHLNRSDRKKLDIARRKLK